MAKAKTMFFCRECGAQSVKWLGRCPECGGWNTFEEEVVRKEPLTGGKNVLQTHSRPLPVGEIRQMADLRIPTSSPELNRVLGGGLVPGSIVLIGGEPGVGKSTLALQVALAMKKTLVLYISGEESTEQIRMRADRIGIRNDQCYILTETLTQEILRHLESIQPAVVIVDSIQTLQTDTLDAPPGSISQIRECASELQRYARQTGTPVILIGHITKDGMLAGPKLLEHMVDAVLQFEGDRNYGYRIVRVVKNRYGPASELGIYEMQQNGLREVDNPSEILVTQRSENLSGIAIASMMEGLRPLMIETQSLVSTAAYGTPQRSATGFDARRLNMLLAVLEKRCGFRLGSKDVFLNIAGGIRVDDPAIDLAVVAAVLSSGEDIPINQKDCFSAEIGLSGEVRQAGRIDQRISEADKLGFDRIFISKYNLKGLDRTKYKIQIVPVSRVDEIFQLLFR
ncbi:MAG: DNA repair protein RadA [Bacteroidales bacterium]|nr:DNA repair protein RadA [Bacteroidales bacterium]